MRGGMASLPDTSP